MRRNTGLALCVYVCAFVLGLTANSAAQTKPEATKQLFEAVFQGNLSQVQISVAGGADINALNSWGVSPVDMAVDKGHFDIVRFLLQARELQSHKIKSAPLPVSVPVTSLSGAPKSTAPAPSAAPVAEVYAPPPEAGPWSATVVTSEPPPPPAALPAGPSPFDQKTVSETALPVIGTVRGPTPVAETEPVAEAVAGAEPKPIEPVANEQTGVWSGLKSLLNLDQPKKAATPAPVTVPVVKAAAKPAMKQRTPVMEVRKPVSLALPSAPVSPPNVKGPPPPIKAKVLPETVSTTPLAALSKDDLETPRVVPVQTKVAPGLKTKTPAGLPIAKVTPIAKGKKTKPKPVTRKASSQPAVQVGTTTLPGKPPEQDGFFSKVMSIFSSKEETKQTEEETTAAAEQPKSGDWTVKNIQQAKVIPRKPTTKVVRALPERRLNGVILSIGRTTGLGKNPPPQAPAPWYYRSCINKKLGSTVFCIEELDWPQDIRTYFLTDSIMYEGTQSIVRYDEGAATYFHTLFPSGSYKSIIEYFSRRYGPPTQKLKRSIAPLAEPRRVNPTVIWQSIAPVTNLLTSLEVRMYDDNRGGFPDTRRGAVYLYHEWSQPVFPQLSSVELMLLRSEEKQR